jgi:hypothetical protein
MFSKGNDYHLAEYELLADLPDNEPAPSGPVNSREIICSEDGRLFEIPEYKLREALNELTWKKQIEMWRGVLDKIPSTYQLPQNMSS